MAKRGERTCIVCGKLYEYCPHCGKGKPEEGWRNLYDSKECRSIFRICSDYAFKHITAAEAKSRLSKYNVGDGSGYSEDIRNNIRVINAEAPAKEKKELPFREQKAENGAVKDS